MKTNINNKSDDQAILQARARALARLPARENNEATVELLMFRLAYETYGMETTFIREVYPLKELTPLPCVPAFVAGIVNVRGQVLSVIDLKFFFQLPGEGLSDLNKIIILSNDDMEFGVLSDSILGVVDIPRNQLVPGPVTATGVREQYLKGVTQDGTIVLDAMKLLTDSRIVVREEI